MQLACKVVSAACQTCYLALFGFMCYEALHTYCIMSNVIRVGGLLSRHIVQVRTVCQSEQSYDQ